MQSGLMASLRDRRFEIVTAKEAGMVNRADEQHLRRATAEECVLFSFNTGDYAAIHAKWLSTGLSHAGIIVSPQQRFSVGEQLRRILNLAGDLSREAMRDRMEYLARWAG